MSERPAHAKEIVWQGLPYLGHAEQSELDISSGCRRCSFQVRRALEHPGAILAHGVAHVCASCVCCVTTAQHEGCEAYEVKTTFEGVFADDDTSKDGLKHHESVGGLNE